MRLAREHQQGYPSQFAAVVALQEGVSKEFVRRWLAQANVVDGDLLNRDFTAAAPDLMWVTDFTYVRSWAGFVCVPFVLDVFAQRIALWQRERDGNQSHLGI